MTDAERIDLDAIRARAEAAHRMTNVGDLGALDVLVHADVPALCAEVERLRADFDAAREAAYQAGYEAGRGDAKDAE